MVSLRNISINTLHKGDDDDDDDDDNIINKIQQKITCPKTDPYGTQDSISNAIKHLHSNSFRLPCFSSMYETSSHKYSVKLCEGIMTSEEMTETCKGPYNTNFVLSDVK